MAEAKTTEKKTLNADVAAKYDCVENFLYGQKLVFPFSAKHGVKNKPAHELTVAEVDKLMEFNAVKGVFTLKVKPAAAEGNTTKK